MRGQTSRLTFQLQVLMFRGFWYTLRSGSYADLHVDRRWLQRADHPLTLRIVAVLP